MGSWPASRERLHAYAEKAAREASVSTTWYEPDAEFESRMHQAIDRAFDDERLRAVLDAFVAWIAPAGWSNSLAAKLLQLTMPGVPDVYQGSELWETSLVDPDNRRPVDFELRRRMLRELDAGFDIGRLQPVDGTAAAKLLVTSRALRLRRDRPELFTRYVPLVVAGSAAAHVVAFDRGGAVTVATRLPVGLGGRVGAQPAASAPPEAWEGTVFMRRSGPAVDVLTGRRFEAGTIPLAELLEQYPVALLADVEAADAGETADADAEAAR